MTQIPRSTYRLQFNRNFTFAQAAEVVPYLATLGISHCYASPYLRARPGSMHGYDIIDHQHLNPEIGTTEDYDRFIAALHEHGMGQILDIVPNHMGVMGSDNAWWLDVLENGQASNYAEFFDIDWEPLKDELQGKVLIPVLGDQYGTVLEKGELTLVFDKSKGEFSIFYFQHRFPVNPREYPRILTRAADFLAQQVEATEEKLLEVQSLTSAFGHLPAQNESSPEKRAERARDKEIHKRRLAAVYESSAEVRHSLDAAVAMFNGTPADPASFELLHELIKSQAFRLAHWRVAADDINYRRFFDVHDLAALRQENPEVFKATHSYVLQLVQEGKVDGLRIDHPDGLYDPRQYFERLQATATNNHQERAPHEHPYVIAEKIVTGDEELPRDWPIQGTTGYKFCALVNGVFVDAKAEPAMTRIYNEFTSENRDFEQIVCDSKKLVMDRLLNSELNVLANYLSRIALSDRHTCDFTVKSLRDALTEIVACFPVYRTYVAGEHISQKDRSYIEDAVACAKQRGGAGDLSVYDFIRSVLLTSRAEGHLPHYQRSVIHFAMRFQQYTGAVMAKGFEDTSFYRYHRLISLNDVGGDPLHFGTSVDEFHAASARCAQAWPHSMVATSTHDSKRSEDVRARINVLSEMPEQWNVQILRWREINSHYRVGQNVPSANDEYLFYQTLVGAWPMDSLSGPPEGFIERMCSYMLKAVREAKEYTSWGKNNEAYESGTISFVRAALASAEFTKQFEPFQRVVAHFGMLNSLSQLVIRLTAPGVPDTYQGSEVWEFNLVDPDNRRAVDYSARQKTLCQMKRTAESDIKPYVQDLTQNMTDARIKMYGLWKVLQLRNRIAGVFAAGDYMRLQVTGSRAEHILAFSRVLGDSNVLVAVPRLCARLMGGRTELPIGEEVWRDTVVQVPHEGTFKNIFTGDRVHAQPIGKDVVIPAVSLFPQFPVAVLASAASDSAH